MRELAPKPRRHGTAASGNQPRIFLTVEDCTGRRGDTACAPCRPNAQTVLRDGRQTIGRTGLRPVLTQHPNMQARFRPRTAALRVPPSPLRRRVSVIHGMVGGRKPPLHRELPLMPIGIDQRWAAYFVQPRGWCQTNANQSLFAQTRSALCFTELTPLGESGGAVHLEVFPAVEGALRVEQVLD